MEAKDSKEIKTPEVAELLEVEEIEVQETILVENATPVDEVEAKEMLQTEDTEAEKSKKESLTVYVDESGSITKTAISKNRYFIVALLFTRDSERLKRYYRKGISTLIKKSPRYKKILNENGEIKGSELPEAKKKLIYERIIRNCKDDFEIGIIVLDNNYTTKEFIENHARTFNYIVQMYFDSFFRQHSKYKDTISKMHLFIDEQNIATDAKYTLDGYLNQHLTVMNPICDCFEVRYSDSKNHLLIQLVDFISNTFYRNIEKHDEISKETVKILLDEVCGNRIFDFSTDHDTKLFLDE